VRILGIHDGRKVVVATVSGRIYSLVFSDQGEVYRTAPGAWQIEPPAALDPVSKFEYYGADFISLPPLFTVAQLYDFQYLYQWEGKGEVKFALAGDGNLWRWSHAIAGLTGIIYYYYPTIGFLIGLAAAFLFGRYLRTNP
jgi:hypothetical protein